MCEIWNIRTRAELDAFLEDWAKAVTINPETGYTEAQEEDMLAFMRELSE